MATSLRNRVRVGGSGFTIFSFESQPIAFAQQVSHTSPAPVGPGPVAIHPIDEPYPVQVITPAASGMGTLTLNLFELYGSRVWERLGSKVTNTFGDRSFGDTIDDAGFLAGSVDLVDVFIRIAERPNHVQVVKFVRPPAFGGEARSIYTENYNNCVVTNIVDGENIEIGTMEVVKQVTIAYTYMTRGTARSKAWDYRI